MQRCTVGRCRAVVSPRAPLNNIGGKPACLSCIRKQFQREFHISPKGKK